MYRKIKRTVRNKFKKIFNDKLHEEEKTYQELFDPLYYYIHRNVFNEKSRCLWK